MVGKTGIAKLVEHCLSHGILCLTLSQIWKNRREKIQTYLIFNYKTFVLINFVDALLPSLSDEAKMPSNTKKYKNI
jgi:hypothetical protein